MPDPVPSSTRTRVIIVAKPPSTRTKATIAAKPPSTTAEAVQGRLQRCCSHGRMRKILSIACIPTTFVKPLSNDSTELEWTYA